MTDVADSGSELGGIQGLVQDQGVGGALSTVAPLAVPGVAPALEADPGDSLELKDLFGALKGIGRQIVDLSPGFGDVKGAVDTAKADNLGVLDQALGYLGAAGIPLLGVSYWQTARSASLAAGEVSTDLRLVTEAARDVANVTPETSRLGRLTGNPDLEMAFPTLSPVAQKATAALGRRDPVPHVTRALFGDAPTAVQRGWATALGEQLVARVPAYADSVFSEFGGDARAAAGGAMALESAKWHWLMSSKQRFSGPGSAPVRKAWEKLTSGADLAADEMDLLLGTQIEVARASQDFSHPEWVVEDLRAGVRGVRMHPDGVKIDMDVLEWDTVGLEDLTPQTAKNRIMQAMQLSPETVAMKATENLVEYFEKYVRRAIEGDLPGVSPDHFLKFRRWYPNAGEEAFRLADAVGSDPEQFVAAAAILSASQSWEMNLPKTAIVMRALRDNPAASAEDLVRAVASTETMEKAIAEFGLDRKMFLKKNGELAKPFVTEAQAKGILTMVREFGDRPQEYFSRPGSRAFKTGSFSQSVYDGFGVEDRVYRANLARLMAGAMELPLAEKLLPVVVDRHAMSIALGFSAPYDESFAQLVSSSKGGYETFAQPYRVAAAKIGEVAGEQLLPQELQALTWVMWREQRGVTKGFEELLNQPVGQPAWAPGRGPSVVFSTNFLQPLMEGQLPGLRPIELAKQGEYTRRVTLQSFDAPLDATKPAVKGRRVMTLSQQADRRVRLRAPGKTWTRTTRPALGGARRGLRPRRAALVDDVEREFERISSYAIEWAGDRWENGLTYGAVYPPGVVDPGLSDAPSMVLRAPSEVGVELAEDVHRRLLAELHDRGIDVEMSTLPPHQGLSSTFVDDAGAETVDAAGLPVEDAFGRPVEAVPSARVRRVRTERQTTGVFTGPPDQLRKAWVALEERLPNGRTLLEDVYQRPFVERLMYLNDPLDAPPGVKAAWEHRFTDPTGARLQTVSLEGDIASAHSVPVFLPASEGIPTDGFLRALDESKNVRFAGLAGSKTPNLPDPARLPADHVPIVDRVFDGWLRVEGQDLGFSGDGPALARFHDSGHRVEDMTLEVIPGERPVLHLREDGPGVKLKVPKSRNGVVTLTVAAPDGKFDPDVVQDAVEAVRRIGENRRIELVLDTPTGLKKSSVVLGARRK